MSWVCDRGPWKPGKHVSATALHNTPETELVLPPCDTKELLMMMMMKMLMLMLMPLRSLLLLLGVCVCCRRVHSLLPAVTGLLCPM